MLKKIFKNIICFNSQDEHALIAKICNTLYNETVKNNEKITIEVNILCHHLNSNLIKINQRKHINKWNLKI